MIKLTKIRFVVLPLLLAFTCGSAQGTVMSPIPLPHDDRVLKKALNSEPENGPLVLSVGKSLYDLQAGFRRRTESELRIAFGTPTEMRGLYARPFCGGSLVVFSGLGYKGDLKTYFLPIGEIGGVLIFPYGRSDLVSSASIYLKVDDDFVPLKKREDYRVRVEWDRKKLQKLKECIQKKLVPTEKTDSE